MIRSPALLALRILAAPLALLAPLVGLVLLDVAATSYANSTALLPLPSLPPLAIPLALLTPLAVLAPIAFVNLATPVVLLALLILLNLVGAQALVVP